MQKPEFPPDEDLRLKTINSLGLLDTSPESRFDRFTLIAQRLFDVPISLVSLIDVNRQWFKSCIGLDVSETSREISFCGHAILQTRVFVIENALEDARFADNPLVTGPPNIRFYAGYPISAPNGQKIGTLCIISDQPKTFPQEDQQLLIHLGEFIEQEVEKVNNEVTDELTGLYNNTGFRNMAERAIDNTKLLSKVLSLVYIDIDDFHEINSKYGHATGDKVLIEFSELLAQVFYGAECIARIEKDTFVVLIKSDNTGSIYQPVQKLYEAVNIRNTTLYRKHKFAFSLGVCSFDEGNHVTIIHCLQQAELLMSDNRKSKFLQPS